LAQASGCNPSLLKGPCGESKTQVIILKGDFQPVGSSTRSVVAT